MRFQSISLYFMLVCVRIEIVSQRENIHDIVNVCNFFSTKTNELSTIPTPAGEVIYWSMCKVGSSCPKESVICLKTDAPTESLVNLGKGFTFLFDGPHDGSSFSLQAEHSEQCRADKTRNYTTYVSFDEKLMKPFVQYKNNDRCVFDIRIPDSTAETSCTKKVDGFLLDFRRLTNDWIVSTAANRTFVLNLCGPAKACDDQDVATCARSFSGSVVDVWGDASTRRITYENGVVRFQFHHGTRSNRLSTKIEVRCKWGVSYGPASYLTPPASSPKLSKFVIESNLGCVKLPMNCKFVDHDTNYEYDLTGLYRPWSGAWPVRNRSNKPIRMNICGPLVGEIAGECEDKSSQICGRILTDDDLSYGTVLVDKSAKDDTLKARLVYGSPCPANDSVMLSANLNWRCSFEEMEPTLVRLHDCSVDILWETPRACPKHTVASSTLNIHDHLGNRDLTDLCVGDRNHTLDPSSYIRYNLCARLGSSCAGMRDVSACLHLHEKQMILGYNKEEKLRSENKMLSATLVGESCGRLDVLFVCDYQAPVTGQLSVKIIHSNCIYEMSIGTPRACAAKLGNKRNADNVCTAVRNELLYNLTGLALSKDNYRYRDDENHVEYSMNVCNPVVSRPNALCKTDSAICMFNLTEPNFKHRFVRIGVYPGNLRIENGQAQLEFTDGDLCVNGALASAKIHFVCSKHHEEGPRLVRTIDRCQYEFTWMTMHACPANISDNSRWRSLPCTVPVGFSTLNLTSVENKHFQLFYEDKANFTFDICHDNYTVTYADGSKQTIRTLRRADGKSLEFSVDVRCNRESKRSWNVVKISFECKRNDDEQVFQLASIENCTANMRCGSKMFCEQHVPSAGEIFDRIGMVVERVFDGIDNGRISNPVHTAYEGTRTETAVFDTKTADRTSPSSQNTRETICRIKFRSKEIYLNDFVLMTVTSRSGNQYSIGFEPRSGRYCGNYICMGNTTLATLRNCPRVIENAPNAEIKLIFNGTVSKDKPFITTVVLKCSDTLKQSEVSSENDTSLTLSYPLEEVCLPSASSNGLMIGGTTVALTLTFVIAIAYYCFRRRRKYGLLSGRGDKSELYLYARNVQS